MTGRPAAERSLQAAPDVFGPAADRRFRCKRLLGEGRRGQGPGRRGGGVGSARHDHVQRLRFGHVAPLGATPAASRPGLADLTDSRVREREPVRNGAIFLERGNL